MITPKLKCAPKAMMELADEQTGAGKALRIGEIARRAETPKRFVVHILPEIRNAGHIASIRGRNVGSQLIKAPAAILLSALLRTIDGPITPLMRRSRRAHQCCGDRADEATCRIRKVFAGVFRSYLVLIRSLTLADLLDQPVAAQQVLSAASA